jgi:glycosyltransferase involved in cell wall biosynthesis
VTITVSRETLPRWTILVPTISERAHLLARLLDRLLPQLDAHAGAVRVLAWHNNGTPGLGVIRDRLIADAGSEYVSFIDDDDLVAEDYVAAVMDALAQGPDHVGFKLEFTAAAHEGGVAGREIVEHSLVHGRWGRTREGVLVRDFTHVDPIRRTIAMNGSFIVRRPGRAEDRHWVKQVRPWLAGMAEVYVDRVLYHYLYDAAVSAWQRPGELAAVRPRLDVDHPYFAWHPESEA